MTSAGTSSGFGANEVPVVIAPSNVRVIQHGHPVVTGGFGQPVGMGNLQSVQVIDPNIRVIQPGHLQVSEGLGQPLGMGNLKTSGDQSSPGPNPGLHNSGYQFRGANPGFSTFPSFDIREFVNQEVRTLGAIQIMIGLIQVGFGSTEACFVNPNSLAFWGGYPYWGGLSVNGSVGMNITSAVFSLAGMVLHLTDLILISSKIPPVQCHNEIQCYLYIQKKVEIGITVLSMLFSFLEFRITCTASHFGCRVTCWNQNKSVLIIPNLYTSQPGPPSTASSPAPIPVPKEATPAQSLNPNKTGVLEDPKRKC